jgi:hypothetical protein
MAVWGNETPKPHCTFQAKAVPGSGKIVCVASAHHAITGGPVLLIDPAVGNNGQAAITRLTPGDYPEAENWKWQDKPWQPWYNAPWPLTEKFFLVAYSRSGLMYEPSGTKHNPDYALGLYVLDADGNREVLFRDGTIGATCPTPLVPRPSPPVLPSVLNPQLATRGLGEMFLSDVYEGLPQATRGTLKQVRVVQIFPKTTRDSNVPRIGVAEKRTRGRFWASRRWSGRFGALPRSRGEADPAAGLGRRRVRLSNDAFQHVTHAGGARVVRGLSRK